jgi:hypothetical protein
VPPGYLAPDFEVRLAPLDERTLEHFIFLERPGGSPRQDAPDYRNADDPPRSAGALGATPSAHGGTR